ncbi:guanine nucleotide-binding protein subunit gamma [Anaeramoeba flamelloides]|uniref:Guanine nucleotide-binding protein subunit gamma n=1 Tax=Anaeramoeba flamelloides TaxID=1746091 RepID=A0AAV7Y4X6_9EUKA|nr:guanine nucleotide-binding protein subunit gamma [Anaeramoeba flamelloides]
MSGQLNRYLAQRDRLSKELESLKKVESMGSVCNSLIQYTQSITDPLVPGTDNSNNPWLNLDEEEQGCCCVLM